MRDRYSIVVGLLFLALIVVAAIHTLSGGGAEATLGLDRSPTRWALPEFAVPAAAGPLEGDANVAQDDCESSAVPCPADARRASPPARSTTPGAIRVCDFFDRPLVISFWFTKGGGLRRPAGRGRLASTQRYRGRVNFLSLDVRDDRDTVRELIREHGWRMPVGYDRDGAVAALYRVGGCPTFAYAYPGGTLQSASIGELTAAQLSDRVERSADGRRGPREVPEMNAAGDAPARLRRRRRAGLGRSPRRRRVPRPRRSPGSRSSAARRSSPEPVRQRLRDLSDRFYGSHAIQMREQPIPWAYRVFFRQIGLDPDRNRTPVEQLAFDRLHDGGFKSRGLPADALTIAMVETGVALRAFDADRLDGDALHPRLGPGRVAARRGRRAGRRDADDRRRGAARSRCSSARPGAGGGRARTAAGSRSSPSRSRACRRSRSTRRSGSPPRRSEARCGA